MKWSGNIREISKNIEEMNFLLDDYRVARNLSERRTALIKMMTVTKKIFISIISQLYEESEVESL